MRSLDLCRALRPQGLRPRSYSGRGMYGEECVGASLDSESDIDTENLPRPTWDSMGKGVIAYWPAVKWTRECERIYPEE